MKYFVSITDLHTSLIEGMRSDGDAVIVFPKRGSRVAKIRALPTLVYWLFRVVIDCKSHVYVSHPFSSVTSTYIAVARRVSFFDDGTGYYGRPSFPSGLRVAINKFITGRVVDWKTISKLERPSFPDLLVYSKIESFSAMFPDLIRVANGPVVAVDLSRAFPQGERSGADRSERVTLFLDSHDSTASKVNVSSLLDALRRAAGMSADGILYFKPHPAQTSRISHQLREMTWAREISGALESGTLRAPIDQVLSFASSGAIVLKLRDSATRIVNIRHSALARDEELDRLFDRLDSSDLRLEE